MFNYPVIDDSNGFPCPLCVRIDANNTIPKTILFELWIISTQKKQLGS